MTVGQFLQTNYTTQTGTSYPLAIDADWVVAARLVDNFAPHAQATPNMSVALDAGHLFNGAALAEVAAQSTATIAAPVSNPRIDRVVIDRVSGAVSVVTGAEAASPSPPAIPAGKAPVAQVLLQTNSTAIGNSMLTDERDLAALGLASGAYATVGAAAGDLVQLDGSGKLPNALPASGVTAGSYTNADITVGADGRVTVASSGSSAFAPAFTSANQTPPAVSSALSVAHGLGRMPYFYRVSLKCLTAEHGYSVGDEIDISGGTNDANTSSYGIGVSADTTNVTVSTATTGGGSPASAFLIYPKGGGSNAWTTPANWAIVVRVW